MSKKKKIFRKKIAAEIAKQMAQAEKGPVSQTPIIQASAPTALPTQISQKPQVLSTQVTNTNQAGVIALTDVNYIKKDLLRIGLLFLAIIAVLLVLYFVDQKTGFLLTLAGKLSGLFN